MNQFSVQRRAGCLRTHNLGRCATSPGHERKSRAAQLSASRADRTGSTSRASNGLRDEGGV